MARIPSIPLCRRSSISALKMRPLDPLILFRASILLFSISWAAADPDLDKFLECLPNHIQPSYPISDFIYTRNHTSFQPTLVAYIKNGRFFNPAPPKPLAIVAANHESHVQATVICAKYHGLQIRIRSGGHDYEGLSFTSNVPFVILDMFNLRAITINIEQETAWVLAGATLGELYYQIANRSKIHAFPAGVCPTVGVGGHLSGGGYGTLMRKYGLSVDNLIDAQIVDVNGNILNRKTMGEDLFWAIRGGGGASFGVILSWTIKLVQVPEKVSVFRIGKTLEQDATDVLFRWQQVASKQHENIFIRAMPQIVNGSRAGEKTILIDFIGFFLGNANCLVPLMNQSFPELGLQQKDCHEMSWIESTVFWAEFPNGTSIDVLLERPKLVLSPYKRKSDYVKNVIPKKGLEEIWKKMIEVENMWMQWNPYGGRMSEISESETPFPHRAGNLFKIQYSAILDQNVANRVYRLRDLYALMGSYASSNPRETFLNYRDLDIGNSTSNQTSFRDAEVYGVKYFKGNFQRLVKVKAKVDPDNFFKHEQSIPPGHI